MSVRHTGERPMAGSTPDSLLALHDAGYREVAAHLDANRSGDALVVDIGCGVGDQSATLAGSNRRVVGVDYDSPTACAASEVWGTGGSRDAGMLFAAMNGERLALRDGAVDAVCSSHIIEHFFNPVRHVAELARVLKADGTAYVCTPNGTADFENPFHVYLFGPDHLASMLSLFFEEVEILGLEGDDTFRSDWATRRASGERLLRLDFLKLRHRLPRRWYVWSYEHVLPIVYRFLGKGTTGIGSGIDHTHLFLSPTIQESTPVLFAIARRPRRLSTTPDARPASVAAH